MIGGHCLLVIKDSGIISKWSECPTVMPTSRARRPKIQSMATRNSVGRARTHPCRTPDVVKKRWENLLPILTVAPVWVWRSSIRFRRISSIPLVHKAFQTPFLSTESKAYLISTNATYNGRLNCRWSSNRNCRARIASIVERPAVNPDCCGRWVICTGIRSNRTFEMTFPSTERRSRPTAFILWSLALIQRDSYHPSTPQGHAQSARHAGIVLTPSLENFFNSRAPIFAGVWRQIERWLFSQPGNRTNKKLSWCWQQARRV